MLRTLIFLLCASLGTLGTSAIAQTPAPATAPTVTAPAAAPVVLPPAPKHGCTQPEYPGRLAPDRRYKQFNSELTAYKDCLQKFAADQKTIAQVYVDAGNAAVNEYNDFVAGINRLLEKDPKDEKK